MLASQYHSELVRTHPTQLLHSDKGQDQRTLWMGNPWKSMLEPPRAWGLTLPLPCSLARCSPPSLPLCFSALSLSLCPINMPLFRGARKNAEMQHLGNLLICDQFLFRNETNIISSNWRILLIISEKLFSATLTTLHFWYSCWHCCFFCSILGPIPSYGRRT